MYTDVFFDNESSHEKGITLAERPSIPVSQPIYSEYAVSGRNGRLKRKDRDEDKQFSLRFNYLTLENSKQIYREVLDWLEGKRRLHFSDDEDVYLLIDSIVPENATNSIREHVDFTLNLTCEPYWYQDIGTSEVTSSSVITNPTSIEAKVIMRVYGEGVCRVSINDNHMEFTDVQGYVVVDGIKGYAERNGIRLDNNMSGKYPVLIPGENEISIGGNTDRIEIDLRWCWR